MATPATKTTTTKPADKPAEAPATPPSETAAGTVANTTDTPKPAPLTKEEKRGLFDAYDKEDQRVDTLKSELEKAKAARSTAIGNIVDRWGHTGPFGWKGDELTAAKTKGSKDGPGGWTFRGKRDQEVEEIG